MAASCLPHLDSSEKVSRGRSQGVPVLVHLMASVPMMAVVVCGAFFLLDFFSLDVQSTPQYLERNHKSLPKTLVR